jgi:hypothetical protein
MYVIEGAKGKKDNVYFMENKIYKLISTSN